MLLRQGLQWSLVGLTAASALMLGWCSYVAPRVMMDLFFGAVHRPSFLFRTSLRRAFSAAFIFIYSACCRSIIRVSDFDYYVGR